MSVELIAVCRVYAQCMMNGLFPENGETNLGFKNLKGGNVTNNRIYFPIM
jgi:hypothetical protein